MDVDSAMSEVAQTPAEAAAEGQQANSASENPLVRALGRIPVPLRAKLLIGFAVVGTLLALVAALGFVALGQSNSRSEQLRRLQQRAVYEQLLLTDAQQLQATLYYRIHYANTKALGFAFGETILNEWNRLCTDAGLRNGCTNGTGGRPQASLPLTLRTIDPKLSDRLASQSWPGFFGGLRSVSASALTEGDNFTQSFARVLGALQRETRARANALVAANRSSFANSRDLLLGIGTGSLIIAVALGLLLSDSVVTPLRRTESRLDEIAAGHFAERLEVPNRDEIGSLAAKVNSTSDELQRVYRELELASEHKSQFVTNVSHELRTPLNAIIGFSDVLHEQMFGELNERQLAYVDDIREAGKHQLSLINEILDLAKIEAGRMDLELSQVALSAILRSAVSLNAERASRGGINLELTSEPETITVTADERRIRQVVLNLVSNAIKFTPPEGRIDLSARVQDGQVEVTVADTGPGISAEDIDSIFEEFEQTTAGKQVEGTGLGLPLSRKLVELHGGRLWAESQPGKGSTFHFTLPVKQKT